MGSIANIKASITPVVPKGTPSPVQLSAPAALQSNPKSLTPAVANKLSADLNTLATALNALHSTAQQSPAMTQLLLTDNLGKVIAAFGNMTYLGVKYLNWLSELHVGDFTLSGDPTKAVFNADNDGEVSIGGAGSIDVHDPYDGNAAWIGTQFDTLEITNAVRGPDNVIRLTVPGHTLASGNVCAVRNMNLVNVPNALGTWTVTVIDARTVDLNNSVWSGPFQPIQDPPAGITTYKPTIDRVLQITAVTNSGGLIEIQTAVAHTYETGDRVNIGALPGVPDGVGQWTVTVIDATHYKLNDSVFGGSLSSPGWCLRYFGGILAQTIAIGASFEDYKLREFADGSLRIRNATIELTSANGSILLDPATPAIILTSSSGATVTLDASNGSIIVHSTHGDARIVLDSSVPNIVIYDSAGTPVVIIGADGKITAGSNLTNMGFIDQALQPAPANPAAGFARIWADSGANLIKAISSSGGPIYFDTSGGGGGSLSTQTTYTSSSRSPNNVYHNTLSVPLYVSVSVAFDTTTGWNAWSDSSSSPTTLVARTVSQANQTGFVFFIVMPGNYYKITNDAGLFNSGAGFAWTEWH